MASDRWIGYFPTPTVQALYVDSHAERPQTHADSRAVEFLLVLCVLLHGPKLGMSLVFLVSEKSIESAPFCHISIGKYRKSISIDPYLSFLGHIAPW